MESDRKNEKEPISDLNLSFCAISYPIVFIS